MGVILPAYSISVDRLKSEFQTFRKSLRKEDQFYFDRLFNLASKHIQAGNAQGHYDPLELVLLSTVLELLKKVDSLESKLSTDLGIAR
jgi:hypothetical protein